MSPVLSFGLSAFHGFLAPDGTKVNRWVFECPNGCGETRCELQSVRNHLRNCKQPWRMPLARSSTEYNFRLSLKIKKVPNPPFLQQQQQQEQQQLLLQQQQIVLIEVGSADCAE